MLLRAENLSKTFEVYKRLALFKTEYQTVQALQNLSVTIEKPQILGVLGANGAGKTTFIKHCLGLVEQTSGSLEVLGFTPHKRQKEFLQQVGFVSGQKQNLDGVLSAYEGLTLSGFMYNMHKQAIKSRIEELTELFGMTEKLYVPIRQLSLGQRMKFEIISSILHTPKILFMDEPTLGLDFEAQSTMHTLLKHLYNQQGITIVLTSHYLNDITVLCDRVVIMDKGTNIYDGRLADLKKVEQENSYLKSLVNALDKG
jgi:ABC-2 type transport system ATP-binding protein